MQTNFTPEQLESPRVAASEKILRTCVHCGFCTATCPTYVLLNDELDSPRGRIYLIKDMLENDKPATKEVVKHVDRCLSCLSCMSTCPSGVNYMHLIDHARAHIEETYQRPFMDRITRVFLANLIPYPNRFRFAMIAGWFAKPITPVLKAIPGLKRLGAMVDLAPKSIPPRSAYDGQYQFAPVTGEIKGRVIMLSGCANPVLRPETNDATIRLLTRHGIEVLKAKKEGCCGSLVHHMGREEDAHAQAKHNIDLWIKIITETDIDAIIVTASGCGTTLKDYAFMLKDDPDYADKAKVIAELAKDITEYLDTIDLKPIDAAGKQTIAYHSACSMQHGQQIKNTPKSLLKRVGFRIKDVPEGHLCCGSAGTYNMMQPDIAGQLKARKIANIEKTKPDAIAAGNIGCITQIGTGTDIPIVHTVELIDWATGGELPVELKGQEGFSS